MPFNGDNWDRPAKQGDVGGIAISTCLALLHIRIVLRRLAEKADIDISTELTELGELTKALEAQFVDMTGFAEGEDVA